MARLPNPGSDDGVWGDVLNEYLSVSLGSDGELKSGTVDSTHIQDGSIGDTQLALISQSKIGGLPAAISAKASNSSVVHNSGNETVDGVKTFSSSPIAPTPTSSTDVANKAYVDGVAGAGAPDATVSSKGLIQLAGDLAGTATAPTVPGLASKEPTIAAGTTSQYYRGDKTFQTLDKATVGLSAVDNTSDVNKPVSTATQTALDAKVAGNGAITGATKTKITYDSKGLVTVGVDATQDDIIDGATNKQYSVTDKTKLAAIAAGATANSPDVTLLNRANHTGAQTATTISDFTEAAQDAVGSALTDTNTIDFTYNDAGSQVTADVKTQMSLASDASGVKLSGDSVAPGNSKYYGTNGTGTKGFYDIPVVGVTKTLQVKIMDDTTALTTGDGKFVFAVSSDLNGLNLTTANAYVTTASSSGTPAIQVRNITSGNVDMLSTLVTIDANENTSYTATTASVVNTTNDNVATGNLLSIDVDVAGTGAKGLGIILTFGP